MNDRLSNYRLIVSLLLIGYCTIDILGSEPWCGFVYGCWCPNCETQTPSGCSCVPYPYIGACRCNDLPYKTTCEANNFIYEIRHPGYWLSLGPEVACVTLDYCSTPDGGNCGVYFEGLCAEPPPPYQLCQWRQFVTIKSRTYVQSELANCP